MNVDVPTYLRLVEETQRLVFLDIEATGLRGDYNSVLVVSLKPYGGEPYSLVTERVGDDRKLVRKVRDEVEKVADCIVTYYGSGFDIPMINTRLLNAGQRDMASIHHIDMYYKLKYRLNMARKSQAHLLRFVNTLQQKLDMNPNEWNEVLAAPKKMLPRMVERCESDVMGLEALYNKTKHLIRDIKRT